MIPREDTTRASVPVGAGAAIGHSIDVVDARSRVDGTIDFALNVEVPGMAHARLLRSPYAHARILAIDARAAEALPGVVTVLTAADFEAADAPARHFGPALRDQPVICGTKVRFVGDPVAAVAAETEEIAAAAVALIEVTYEQLPHVTDIEDALADGAPLVHDSPPAPRAMGYVDIKLVGAGGNICTKFQLRKGDVDTAMAEAEVVIDRTYHSPAVQHVPMEPHVVLATYDRRKNQLTVVSSTQSPSAVRDALCEMFRVRTSAVRVAVPPLGGGYGAKTYAKFEPVTAALAWKAGRPVKLVLPREEEFISITKHAAKIRMRTGATREGRILSRDVQVWFNAGAYADISPRLIKNGGYSCVGPYDIPNVRIDSYAVYTNLPPAGAYRGYGVSQAAWAYEQQMDELADLLEMDPLELRRRNLLTEGQAFATGEIIGEAHWDTLLNKAAAAIDWSPATRSSVTPDGRYRGIGLAVILKSTITPSTTHAAVRLDSDGTLQVLTSAVEMGQGAHTVLSQLAADAVGLPVENVHIAPPDTQYTPYDQTTSSSRTTRAMGGAITRAGRIVQQRLRQLAADLLEVDAEDLVVSDGQISVVGVPSESVSVAEVLYRTRTGSIGGDGEVVTSGGLDPETGQGVASDHWHQGAASAEVEIDPATGKVYVKSLYAVAHAGRVINPKLAKLQLHGSAIFGMSHALLEELIYDNGVLTNPNLSEYSIMAMGDMPDRLEVELTEDPGEAQVHGLGETVLPPVIAAIGNAVASAIGRRVRRLPITPERVLKAIEEDHGQP